jgi:flagellar basal-body rod protein FlgB
MHNTLDDTMAFHETALRFRAHRQQLLASNAANADTPNYKARDIEFSKALQSAMTRGAQATSSLVATSPKHLLGNATTILGGGTPLLYRTVQQGSVDGNTVDMDVERNHFIDNAVRYEASLTMISGQIKSLLTAIQG